jgi:hypothetical protein
MYLYFCWNSIIFTFLLFFQSSVLFKLATLEWYHRPIRDPLGREYWINYSVSGFLMVEWIGSSPTPSPLSCQKARPATHWNTEKERNVTDGRGGKVVGKEPKPGPLQIVQYSLPHYNTSKRKRFTKHVLLRGRLAENKKGSLLQSGSH